MSTRCLYVCVVCMYLVDTVAGELVQTPRILPQRVVLQQQPQVTQLRTLVHAV